MGGVLSKSERVRDSADCYHDMTVSSLSYSKRRRHSYHWKSYCEERIRTLRKSAPVTLCIQLPNGNKATIKKKGSDKIRDVKDAVASIEDPGFPRDYQILKIAGKPHIILVDSCEISEYHKWTNTVLDMILELNSGEFYICVCYRSPVWYNNENCGQSSGQSPKNVILKVNSFDTILTVKHLVYTKLDIKPNYQDLEYKSANQHTPEKCKTSSGKLCDTCTLEDYNVLLFHHLLKLRIYLLCVEDDSVKHIYLVKTRDDLDTSRHNPNEYVLSVEYNTTVNKLYSMIADHYKICVEHVELIVYDNQIVHCSDTELHVLFYPPIILRHVVVFHAATSRDLFSDFSGCQSLKHCELAMRSCDDPIIKQLVDKSVDAWVILLDAFKFGDDVKAKIQENSEDNHIRCMDVMHRMYHHDDDLTWEFVEIQVRKVDPQLGDVLKTLLQF